MTDCGDCVYNEGMDTGTNQWFGERQQQILRLSQVRQRTRQAQRAADKWHESIRLARAEGITLRAIAEAAGLTHSGIAKICKEKP